MEGVCRDLKTGPVLDGHETVREDRVVAHLGQDRVIQQIAGDRIDLKDLVGARGGGHLRGVLDEKIHEERVDGTPLYLLLDDISGASLVSGWAWSRWIEPGMEAMMSDGFEEHRHTMENICHGFATGSSALAAEAPPDNNPQVVELANPQDAASWHEIPASDGVNFRRARRIDVWRDEGILMIEVGFQDSARDPELGRVAIHEYVVHARADMASEELVEISATPHVLPFPECPGAVNNIQLMLGTPMREMRLRVIDVLPGVKGCTHLNDVMRGLAEAPVLASYL